MLDSYSSGKKAHLIERIEDFKHKRSRELADTYKVQVLDIVPNYLELMQAAGTDQRIAIDSTNPDTAINVFTKYKRGAASAAIILYEMTKSKSIKFLYNKCQILNIGTASSLIEHENVFAIGRDNQTIEECNRRAEVYENELKKLDEFESLHLGKF